MNIQKLIDGIGQDVNSGKFEKALKSACEWQKIKPDSLDAHYWVSWLHLRLNNKKQALEIILNIINTGISHPTFLIHLAKCYLENGESGLALKTAKQIDLSTFDNSKHLHTLGEIFAAVNENELALIVYTKIVTLTPDSITALFQKAVALNHCHNIKDAEDTYRKILRLNPVFFRVYFMLSYLKKQTLTNNNIELLKNVLQKNHNNENAITFLNLSLFKEYEDTENYSQAFRHLKTANDFINQSCSFSPTTERELTQHTITTFNSNYVSQNKCGHRSEEPIFIVGMPRTGTTLVEQILTCSDDVYTAGELKNFTIELTRLINDNLFDTKAAEILDQIKNINVELLGKNYIESTRPQTGQTKYFIDKMPTNYKLVGAILMALPEAKIIHLVRNPLDTCFSNYKQIFETGVYNSSYSLTNIAEQFVSYYQLMNHWKKLFGNRIYEVCYENLVSDQEEESRKLINYCNLQWSNKFLKFHDHITASSTASVAQIRLPIYQSSVNKWRNYRTELSPAIEILTKYHIPYE